MEEGRLATDTAIHFLYILANIYRYMESAFHEFNWDALQTSRAPTFADCVKDKDAISKDCQLRNSCVKDNVTIWVCYKGLLLHYRVSIYLSLHIYTHIYTYIHTDG